MFVCRTRAELDTHCRRLLTAQIVAVVFFVLFPLKIVPVGEAQDPDKLRPGQDYPGEPSYQVWQKYLPKGLVMFDWVKIVYAR